MDSNCDDHSHHEAQDGERGPERIMARIDSAAEEQEAVLDAASRANSADFNWVPSLSVGDRAVLSSSAEDRTPRIYGLVEHNFNAVRDFGLVHQYLDPLKPTIAGYIEAESYEFKVRSQQGKRLGNVATTTPPVPVPLHFSSHIDYEDHLRELRWAASRQLAAARDSEMMAVSGTSDASNMTNNQMLRDAITCGHKQTLLELHTPSNIIALARHAQDHPTVQQPPIRPLSNPPPPSPITFLPSPSNGIQPEPVHPDGTTSHTPTTDTCAPLTNIADVLRITTPDTAKSLPCANTRGSSSTCHTDDHFPVPLSPASASDLKDSVAIASLNHAHHLASHQNDPVLDKAAASEGDSWAHTDSNMDTLPPFPPAHQQGTPLNHAYATGESLHGGTAVTHPLMLSLVPPRSADRSEESVPSVASIHADSGVAYEPQYAPSSRLDTLQRMSAQSKKVAQRTSSHRSKHGSQAGEVCVPQSSQWADITSSQVHTSVQPQLEEESPDNSKRQSVDSILSSFGNLSPEPSHKKLVQAAACAGTDLQGADPKSSHSSRLGSASAAPVQGEDSYVSTSTKSGTDSRHCSARSTNSAARKMRLELSFLSTCTADRNTSPPRGKASARSTLARQQGIVLPGSDPAASPIPESTSADMVSPDLTGPGNEIDGGVRNAADPHRPKTCPSLSLAWNQQGNVNLELPAVHMDDLMKSSTSKDVQFPPTTDNMDSWTVTPPATAVANIIPHHYPPRNDNHNPLKVHSYKRGSHKDGSLQPPAIPFRHSIPKHPLPPKKLQNRRPAGTTTTDPHDLSLPASKSPAHTPSKPRPTPLHLPKSREHAVHKHHTAVRRFLCSRGCRFSCTPVTASFVSTANATSVVGTRFLQCGTAIWEREGTSGATLQGTGSTCLNSRHIRACSPDHTRELVQHGGGMHMHRFTDGGHDSLGRNCMPGGVEETGTNVSSSTCEDFNGVDHETGSQLHGGHLDVITSNGSTGGGVGVAGSDAQMYSKIVQAQDSVSDSVMTWQEDLRYGVGPTEIIRDIDRQGMRNGPVVHELRSSLHDLSSRMPRLRHTQSAESSLYNQNSIVWDTDQNKRCYGSRDVSRGIQRPSTTPVSQSTYVCSPAGHSKLEQGRCDGRMIRTPNRAPPGQLRKGAGARKVYGRWATVPIDTGKTYGRRGVSEYDAIIDRTHSWGGQAPQRPRSRVLGKNVVRSDGCMVCSRGNFDLMLCPEGA